VEATSAPVIGATSFPKRIPKSVRMSTSALHSNTTALRSASILKVYNLIIIDNVDNIDIIDNITDNIHIILDII